MPSQTSWKNRVEIFLKLFIVIDAIVLVLIFLNTQFDLHVIPAPGKKLNNPLGALLAAVFLLGVLNRDFRDTWTGRLKTSLLESPNRYYFFGILLALEVILETMWFFYPEDFHWNLNAEQGYGTHFSTVQLFILGVFVLIVAWETHPHTGDEKYRKPWYLVACLFLYLALDDGLGIHENFIKWSQSIDPDGTVFHFIHEWLWFYGPFILIAVALLIRFFFTQFKRYPDVMAIMFVALSFWVSVILLEGLAKNVVDPLGLSQGRFLIAVEEGSEMLGATLFLFGFSRYLRKVRAEDRLKRPEA